MYTYTIKYLMNGSFTLIITTIVVAISLAMYAEGQSNEVDFVESYLDGRKYLVRNLPDKAEASTLLSLIRARLIKLIEHCKRKHKDDPRIQRLATKFRPDQISETPIGSKYTSYSVDKGKKIVFCIRQRNEQNELVDINTMMFVSIHELAHLMTVSIGHTEEFWENMKFLLQTALSEDVQLYNYQPFHQAPKEYCGTMITDTPHKVGDRL